MESIKGELVIDEKGTIWFNSEIGICRLRIQNIPEEKIKRFFRTKTQDSFLDLRLICKEFKEQILDRIEGSKQVITHEKNLHNQEPSYAFQLGVLLGMRDGLEELLGRI